MILSENIKKELENAIKVAVTEGREFPIKVTSKGNITHRITRKASESGHFLTTIEHGGEVFRIYLI